MLLVRFNSKNSGDSNNETGDDEANSNAKALQNERLRLEALIMGTTTDATNVVPKKKKQVPKSSEWKDYLLLLQRQRPPLLTAIARERYETEIQLLKSLVDSDDAISELWTLWYHSRGPAGAKALQVSDMLTAKGPEYWMQAEQTLQQLVIADEEEQQEEVRPPLFVEAVNRLATLYYLQGRLPESKQMCEIVLAVKPWHFGAVSGIVMVCSLLKDNDGMMAWANQRMPPLPPPPNQNSNNMLQRKEWVDGMVQLAQTRLQEAEQRVQDSFQELPLPDEPTSAAWFQTTPQQQEGLLDEDDDAWQ
jgi:exonuclease VII small subunit